MQRIEGVEAVFGYCAFDVSACAVVEEDTTQETARKRLRL